MRKSVLTLLAMVMGPLSYKLAAQGAGTLSYEVAAQSVSNAPHTTVEYVDEKEQKLPSAEGAHRKVESVYQDSIKGVVRVFYPDGTLCARTEQENIRLHKNDGLMETWYENGQLHVRDHWLHGKRNGELVTYYKDGTLRRQEQFVEDKSKQGQCFNAQGELVPYFPYEIMPEYPGGFNALLQQLAKTTRYPEQAIRQKVGGRVLVSFFVDTTGTVQDVTLAKSVHPLLDEEAMRVIKSISAKWQPGTQDGTPVTVRYTLPLTFAIQNSLFKKYKGTQ